MKKQVSHCQKPGYRRLAIHWFNPGE